MINGFVSFVAEDMRSFKAVVAPGLNKIIAACIRADVSLKTENVDIKEIIPHPTTISRKLKEWHEEDFKKLIKTLNLK